MRIDETYFSKTETSDEIEIQEENDFFDYQHLVNNYDFVFMLHMFTKYVFSPERFQLPEIFKIFLKLDHCVKDSSEIYLSYCENPYPPLNVLTRGKRKLYYKSFEDDEVPDDIYIFFGINATFRNLQQVQRTFWHLSSQLGTTPKFYLAAAHGRKTWQPSSDLLNVPFFISKDWIDEQNTDMFYSLLTANDKEFEELVSRVEV